MSPARGDYSLFGGEKGFNFDIGPSLPARAYNNPQELQNRAGSRLQLLQDSLELEVGYSSDAKRTRFLRYAKSQHYM
jgi:hypothetical protein